jgi:plasmid stabilization system protein ParE
MAKEIVWTKRANGKFNKIIGYLESEWGENVTKVLLNGPMILLN